MELDYTFPESILESEYYIETDKYIGSGHFIFIKSDLEKHQVQRFQEFSNILKAKIQKNESIEKVISDEIKGKFIPKEIKRYNYFFDTYECVSDGENSFNPKYYWLVTSFLNCELFYQQKVLGSKKIDSGKGLFSVVKNGKIIGSLMSLNPNVVFKGAL